MILKLKIMDSLVDKTTQEVQTVKDEYVNQFDIEDRPSNYDAQITKLDAIIAGTYVPVIDND